MFLSFVALSLISYVLRSGLKLPLLFESSRKPHPWTWMMIFIWLRRWKLSFCHSYTAWKPIYVCTVKTAGIWALGAWKCIINAIVVGDWVRWHRTLVLPVLCRGFKPWSQWSLNGYHYSSPCPHTLSRGAQSFQRTLLKRGFSFHLQHFC
jgi:hypothetical protein